MTRPRTIAAAVVLLGVGVALGRISVRQPSLTTVDTKSTSASQDTASWNMLQDTQGWKMQQEAVRWKVKRTFLPQPGCKESALVAEEAETTKDAEIKSVEVVATRTDGSSAKLLTMNNESHTRTEMPTRAWSLHVAGGLDFNGGRIVGGQIVRRMWDRVDIGVQLTNRGILALVGLGL